MSKTHPHTLPEDGFLRPKSGSKEQLRRQMALLEAERDMEQAKYNAALACLRRYRGGWSARRTGLGFLTWNRGDAWERMGEDEALVVWASDPLERHPILDHEPILLTLPGYRPLCAVCYDRDVIRAPILLRGDGGWVHQVPNA